MNRWFSLLIAALLAMSLGHDTAQAAEQPNILWISCEDISPDLRCYGDDYAISPHIDQLAAEGVLYSRAFSHSGVCAPTRSGIITGMYPTSIGTPHMRCRGVPPAEVRCFSQYLRAAGYYCTNNKKTDYQFESPLTAWDESSGKAHWRNRSEGQPFFAIINLTISHESQIRNPRPETKKRVSQLSPAERHDPAQATLPSYYPDTPLVRRDWANYHDNITAMDKQVAEILQQLEDDGLAEDTIVWFWGDHGRGLPRGKRWIYDSGLQFPLIIRVPEKWKQRALPEHPEQLAAGTVNDDLVAFVDFAPTMLSLAGIDIPEHIQGQAFLGPQKAAPRKYIFAARDRMDERYDLIRAARDKQFKYIRNDMPFIPYSQNISYMNEMPTMQEMRRLDAAGELVGPQKLYFRQVKPAEELYDTEADPEELNNLADDPKYADKLAELRSQTQQWRKDIGDMGLIPEPIFDEMKRPGGKYAVTADPIFTITDVNDAQRSYQVAIASPTAGSSIAYRFGKGPYQLYTEPVTVKPGQKLSAVACRIGFRDSQAITFRPGATTDPPAESETPDYVHWREALDKSDLLEQLAELKAIDSTQPESVAKYCAALASEQAAMRYWAITELYYADAIDEGIANKIRPYLDDPSPVVCIAAAQAIADTDPDAALAVLTKMLQHPQDTTRLSAALALDELGETARPAIPAMQNARHDKFKYVVRVCDGALARLGVPVD